MTDPRSESGRNADWERSERTSFWIALAIALVPIPLSLLITWAVGSSLLLDESELDHEKAPAHSVKSEALGRP